MNLPDHTAIMGQTGVWIPAKPQLLQGQVKQWASLSHVSSIDVPGYWYHKPGSIVSFNSSAAEGEKVILYVHGGAYIIDTAHPSGITESVSGMLQHSTIVRRAFSVEYRLSASAPYTNESQFPAALIDAIAGYDYLVNDLGFKPQDVLIMGDSAGGHLALMLTRHIVENLEIFGERPGGLILPYPWCDMSESHNRPHENGSAFRYADRDMLGPLYDGVMLYATISFLGTHSPDANPYLSPGSKDPSMDLLVSFKGFPPTFLCVGGCERLKDQIRVVRDRMIRDMGEEMVRYEESEGVIHGFLGFKWHEPERTEMLKKIEKWMSEFC